MTWDPSRYLKDRPIRWTPIDLNRWIAQEREAAALMDALHAYALSIGCTSDGMDGIRATPEQGRLIEAWWIEHAPPVVESKP